MPPNNLSLKQRLAALSLSPSSPSSPHGQALDNNLLSPRRAKALFTPPWIKKNEPGVSVRREHNELEVVQEVMGRMIFQAGVDFETRPMVVMNASAMPDPREVNYDLLLSRILSYLNLYVEADYTVVFFAAGGKHTPGWNWVWKAYRSLSRKYRKNLKKLYIVHSSFFSKMLFSLAGAIISPKFFRKISYIDTLSELAIHVPLTQIDIPPAVYQENLKQEVRISLPNLHSSPSAAFGVPLEDIMGYEGEKGPVPRVVRDCIQYLRESGLNDEGLFRRSPSSQLLRAAQEAYDRGQVVSLEVWEGAGGGSHLAAVLLKKYLRDLPTPIFGEDMYALIKRCPMPTSDPSDMEAVVYVREVLLPELPPCVYILLSHYLHLMHEVHLRSASNRMDAHNLAVVLSPNLVKGTNPIRDVQMCLIPTVPGPSPSTLAPPPLSSNPNSPSAPAFPVSPSFPSSSLSPLSTTTTNTAAISENKTTLGMVIKLCIQRYYEVFDEVLDRTEVLGFGVPGMGMGTGVGFLGTGVRGEGYLANGRYLSPNASASASVEGSSEGSVVDGIQGHGQGEGGGVSLSFRAAATTGDEPKPPPKPTNGFASASGALGNGLGIGTGKGTGMSSKVVDKSNKTNKDSLAIPTNPIHHRRKSSGLSGGGSDEDIDDEMLVMPIGPGSFSFTRHGHGHSQSTPSVPSTPNSPSFASASGPPSARGVGNIPDMATQGGFSTFRHRSNLSAGSGTSSGSRGIGVGGGGRSIHTVDVGGTMRSGAPSSFTMKAKPKARSMFSVDSGSGSGSSSLPAFAGGTITKKGSISVGRGTSRQSGKGIGAGVEAVGITASGFFSAPGSGDANKDKDKVADKDTDVSEANR